MLRLEIEALRDADYELDIIGSHRCWSPIRPTHRTRFRMARSRGPERLQTRRAEPHETSDRGSHRNQNLRRYTRRLVEAFELVPSPQVADVWHASVFTRDVLDDLERVGTFSGTIVSPLVLDQAPASAQHGARGVLQPAHLGHDFFERPRPRASASRSPGWFSSFCGRRSQQLACLRSTRDECADRGRPAERTST